MGDKSHQLETIKQGKLYLRANWEKGIDCPCCGQLVKLWKKRIISTAVASLCRLVYLYNGFPIHLDKFNVVPKDRNFNQLTLWGLIRPEKNEDEKKRSSGMWHPTQKGMAFVRGQIDVAKHVRTYDNKIIDFSKELIGIEEALNNKFDYQKLMKENKL